MPILLLFFESPRTRLALPLWTYCFLITHSISSHRAIPMQFSVVHHHYVSDKFQRIEKQSCTNYSQIGWPCHSEPLIRPLLWWPVHSRIHFELAIISYKALFNNSSHYLASLICNHQPVCSPLLLPALILSLPSPSSKCFGSRSFRWFAPEMWNPTPRNSLLLNHGRNLKRRRKFVDHVHRYQ